MSLLSVGDGIQPLDCAGGGGYYNHNLDLVGTWIHLTNDICSGVDDCGRCKVAMPNEGVVRN